MFFLKEHISHFNQKKLIPHSKFYTKPRFAWQLGSDRGSGDKPWSEPTQANPVHRRMYVAQVSALNTATCNFIWSWDSYIISLANAASHQF